MSPEQRVVLLFYVQIIQGMANLKKSIETQKVINEAVDAIFKHFKDEVSYPETLETMADAQVELMELMEMNRLAAEFKDMGVMSVPLQNLTDFIHEVNVAYRLLRPFAKLMGQVYGNEE
jgi:hypothetical protein